MRDLMQELTMVQRRVADGEVPAGPAKVVALSRTYAAGREVRVRGQRRRGGP